MSKSKSTPVADEEVTELKIKGQKEPVEVTRTVDTGKAIHLYYTDPNDNKEKRVIRLKRG